MQAKRLTLVGAAALGMFAANPALAGDGGVRIGIGGISIGGSSSCAWSGHDHAGRIVIDGCSTTIRSDCDVRGEVVRALRRAGYDAQCRNGEVVVRFGSCRPNILWCAEGTGARFIWERGCVRIRFSTVSCSACTPRFPVIRWDWCGPSRGGRDHGHNGGRDRGGRDRGHGSRGGHDDRGGRGDHGDRGNGGERGGRGGRGH